jgi:hypothetical protein
MSWLDPKQWILVGLFCVAAFIGIQFWEHRLIEEGRQLEQGDNAKRLIVENAKAAEKTATWQKGKDDALIEANKRAQALKDLADKLATTNRGLRDELTAQRGKLSTASIDAVRQYAAAANLVFGECSAEVERLAKDADGHSSDSLMLQQAWPK